MDPQQPVQSQSPQQEQYQQPPQYQEVPQPQPQYQAPQPRVFLQPGNSRALAMMFYWSGIIGLIMGLIVCDKDKDPFIRHHLNQAVVLLIAYLICSLLAFVLVGYVLMIVLLVFQIMATVEAYNGTMGEMPLLGKLKIWK